MNKLDKYLIGINSVDTQHMKLLLMVGNIGTLIKNAKNYDRYDDIVGIINELKRYTIEHFTHEEELMMSVRYPYRFTHKTKHSTFVRRITDIDLREVDESQFDYLVRLLDFVSAWIVSHIDKEDREFAKWCSNNGIRVN